MLVTPSISYYYLASYTHPFFFNLLASSHPNAHFSLHNAHYIPISLLLNL
jgi:hypothetical protein